MSDPRDRLIRLALTAEALRFGEFTLKSGRVSPYFFNAGRFDHGAMLHELAECYADAVSRSGIAFDTLFGPAYKGIPLATALGCAFAARGRDVGVAFSRKEAKAHGEGGQLIGAPLAGRQVLIVDDVLTAGTAVRQALRQIEAAGGLASGLVIALDRQERLDESDARSAVERLRQERGLPVIAVATLDDLLAFASENPELDTHRPALLAYRDRYGAIGSLP